MKAFGKVLFFLAMTAIFAAGTVGCDEAEECVACGVEGCPTLEEVADDYFQVVACCVGLVEDHESFVAEWTARWKFVPPALADACVSSIDCPGRNQCGDDPVTWGDEDAMDACMRDIVDSGATSCSGGNLKIAVNGIGCMEVDCGAYCGGSGECVYSGAAADCSCGFLKN